MTKLKKSTEIQALACKLESGLEFMQNLQKHLEIVEQPLQWAKDNEENSQKGLQSAFNKITNIMSTLDGNNETLQDSIDEIKAKSKKMNPDLNAFSKQLKEIRHGFTLRPCKKRNRENEDNIIFTRKNKLMEDSSSPSKKRRKISKTKSSKRSHSLPQLNHQQDVQAEHNFTVVTLKKFGNTIGEKNAIKREQSSNEIEQMQMELNDSGEEDEHSSERQETLHGGKSNYQKNKQSARRENSFNSDRSSFDFGRERESGWKNVAAHPNPDIDEWLNSFPISELQQDGECVITAMHLWHIKNQQQSDSWDSVERMLYKNTPFRVERRVTEQLSHFAQSINHMNDNVLYDHKQEIQDAIVTICMLNGNEDRTDRAILVEKHFKQQHNRTSKPNVSNPKQRSSNHEGNNSYQQGGRTPKSNSAKPKQKYSSSEDNKDGTKNWKNKSNTDREHKKQNKTHYWQTRINTEKQNQMDRIDLGVSKSQYTQQEGQNSKLIMNANMKKWDTFLASLEDDGNGQKRSDPLQRLDQVGSYYCDIFKATLLPSNENKKKFITKKSETANPENETYDRKSNERRTDNSSSSEEEDSEDDIEINEGESNKN
jgi:hypothetical protein